MLKKYIRIPKTAQIIINIILEIFDSITKFVSIDSYIAATVINMMKQLLNIIENLEINSNILSLTSVLIITKLIIIIATKVEIEDKITPFVSNLITKGVIVKYFITSPTIIVTKFNSCLFTACIIILVKLYIEYNNANGK